LTIVAPANAGFSAAQSTGLLMGPAAAALQTTDSDAAKTSVKLEIQRATQARALGRTTLVRAPPTCDGSLFLMAFLTALHAYNGKPKPNDTSSFRSNKPKGL